MQINSNTLNGPLLVRNSMPCMSRNQTGKPLHLFQKYELMGSNKISASQITAVRSIIKPQIFLK